MLAKQDVVILKNLILEHGASNILDLGAGDTFTSLYCASLGARVDAVDNKKFPDYITQHSRITLVRKPLEQFIANSKRRYDLIILRSVLHFLPSTTAYQDVLQKLPKLLKRGGFVYIATMTSPKGSGRFLYTPREITEALHALKLVLKKTEKSLFRVRGKVYKHFFWRLVYKK